MKRPGLLSGRSAVWRWLTCVLLACGAGWLGWRYFATRNRVDLVVNGVHFPRYTHQTSPEGLLREVGLTLADEDLVVLLSPSSSSLVDGSELVVRLARPVVIASDGALVETLTTGDTIGQALDDSSAEQLDGDRYLLQGRLVNRDSPLPAAERPEPLTLANWAQALRHSVTVSIRRATPITVRDGDSTVSSRTAAVTVGEALQDQGIALFEGDLVTPGLQAPIVLGLTIQIARSLPLTLTVGGSSRMTRSRVGTVQALLDEQAVVLGELDYVKPIASEALERDLAVQVVRVIEERHVQEIPLPFETIYQPDPAVEIDNHHIADWGREGAERREVLVRYEDQVETARTETDAWIEREPRDRLIEYGTQIVLRQMDTPDGPISYWRTIRMLATSYNAPTAGKPMDHPTYGITRLGWRARFGIIAVDPRVISLEQNMYVPGYGPGVAGDTGGAILWRRIDLCYDDDNLVLWKKWVDVYLLEPIPPEDEINWIIPNYPVEKE